MPRSSNFRMVVGALAGVALLATPAGAVAAAVPDRPPPAINPLVALSALGSDASRAALCGASLAAAAHVSANSSVAAVAQGAPTQGCVLPVVDQIPPPSVSEVLPPPPVPPMPAVAGGFGASSLLLALAGITAAALLAVVLLRDRNNNNVLSPT